MRPHPLVTPTWHTARCLPPSPLGPGDALDTPTPGSSAATPHKLQTPTSAGFSSSGGGAGGGVGVATTPLLTAPDLDRSAVMVAKDHLTSGNTSNCVSLSGDYKDALGKVIRRSVSVL